MERPTAYQIEINGFKKDVFINNPLGYNFPTYQDELLVQFFDIKSEHKVLDVGGGSNPFKRANVVTDLFLNESHHRGGVPLTRIPGIEYVESDIMDLPFEDKEFDFVVCRHVLEHVTDPIQACKELSRVAKRGFIEVPSRINEYLHGYPNHLWLCDFKNGVLSFEPKPFIRNPFKNVTRKLHYIDPDFQINFEYFNRNIFCTQVYWENQINVHVLEKKPEFNYFDYNDPVQAAVAHLDYALNYMSFLLPQLNEEIESQLYYSEKFLPNNPIIKEVKKLFNSKEKYNSEDYLKLVTQIQEKDLLNLVKESIYKKGKSVDNYNSFFKSIINTDINYPYVSIIVRTFNREDLLIRCLQSIDEQYYPNIEVIVVNDGGKDVNHLLEKRKFKCHYIKHADNLGKAAALNSGLKMARGKYINILDDDDMIYPEHTAMLAVSLENSDYKVAYTNSFLNVEENIDGKWITVQKKLQYSQPYDFQLLLKTNYLPILNVMFEREILIECGYVNEEFDVLEDWDLWIRIALKNKFFHIKKITAEYSQRISGDNATQNLSEVFSRNRNIIYKKYRHLIISELPIQILNPLQDINKNMANFLLIPDSIEECKKVIKYFTENFYGSLLVGLYILHQFSNDEINQLYLETDIKVSKLIHFITSFEMEDNWNSFIYSFDFIIESHSYKMLVDKVNNLNSVPIVCCSEAKRSLESHPLFGLFCLKEKSKPLVSIVVLTKNQLSYTKLCVKSIYDYTRKPFELIIVDNGSDPETKTYLQTLSEQKQNVKVIFNEENLGYGAGNNQGINESTGEYIIFLNNDVIVTENWVTDLIEAIGSDPKNGICGPVSNQVAGIQKIEDPSYLVEDLVNYSRKHKERYRGIYLNTNRVIGFCMLVKREVIEKIGGFDLNFGIGNFEDDDFCVRAWLAGYNCVIAKEVFIHHFGSVTFKNEGFKYENILIENMKKFFEKWDLPIPKDSLPTGYNFNQIQKHFDKIKHYCPLINEMSISNYLKQSIELFNKGDFTNCEVVLLQCLQLDKNNKEVWYNLLVTYMQINDFSKASLCFEHLNDQSVEVGHLKIIWYIFNGKLDEASGLLKILLQKYPNDSRLIEEKKYIESLKPIVHDTLI